MADSTTRSGPAVSLAAAWSSYVSKVERIAELAFRDTVLPFCRQRQWNFIAGNGTWWIGPAGGECVHAEDLPDDKDWQRVCALLSLEVRGLPSNDLGSLMPDAVMTKGETEDGQT